jgi:hypothetical protein
MLIEGEGMASFSGPGEQSVADSGETSDGHQSHEGHRDD